MYLDILLSSLLIAFFPYLQRYEGFFGVIGTLLIMAPITYYLGGTEGEGIHEDIIDTWAVRVHIVAQRRWFASSTWWVRQLLTY